MTTIAAQERATYEEVLALDRYGDFSPGVAYLPAFLDMLRERGMCGPWHEEYPVLDAGCGTGKGAVVLRAAGFRVTVADLTYDGLVPEAQGFPRLEPGALWDDRPAEQCRWAYAVCCDVLEHIPTAFTMLAAARLLEKVTEGVFFSIALVPDQFGAWVGKPLHQTVQSFTWWRDSLHEIGAVLEARDLGTVGLYLVTR